MPKRILLLVAIYFVAWIGLGAWVLTDYESQANSAGLLLMTYMTFAFPLGIWSALGKSWLPFRILGCSLPGVTLAVWMFGYPLIMMVVESSIGGVWHEMILGYLEILARDLSLAVVLFLSPTVLGVVLAKIGKRRGLRLTNQVDRLARTGNQFSLLKLALLTSVACAVLGMQHYMTRGFGLELAAEGETSEEGLTEHEAQFVQAATESESPTVKHVYTYHYDAESTEDAPDLQPTVAPDAAIEPAIFDEDIPAIEFDAAVTASETEFEAVGVPNGDEYYEASVITPSLWEQALAFACGLGAVGMPFLLVSVIGVWTFLFPNSPWIRMIWGVPLSILCGSLLLFGYADGWTAAFWIGAYLVLQFAVLWIVRSTGYRLVWTAASDPLTPQLAPGVA